MKFTKKERVEEYPCLKEHSDGILRVLFNAPGTGIVITAEGDWTVGEYSTGWDEDQFKLIHGTLEF